MRYETLVREEVYCRRMLTSPRLHGIRFTLIFTKQRDSFKDACRNYARLLQTMSWTMMRLASVPLFRAGISKGSWMLNKIDTSLETILFSFHFVWLT